VRVDARRLRDKLREYYSESTDDPILITLPKGSYAPLFERNPASPLVHPFSKQEPARPRWSQCARSLSAGPAGGL